MVYWLELAAWVDEVPSAPAWVALTDPAADALAEPVPVTESPWDIKSITGLFAARSKGGRSTDSVSRMACLGDRVVIGGVNMHKRHVKRSKAYPQGGRIDFEAPLHISNVRPCDEKGRPLKLKVRVSDEGVRELVYQEDGKPVVWRSTKRAKK